MMTKKKYLPSTHAMFSNTFDFFHNLNEVNNVETKYHYHDFYEIFFFLQGDVSFVVEGRKYKMQPGNVLLIHYHDLHQANMLNSNCYERFYIWLTPTFFETNSTALTPLDLFFSEVQGRRSRILSLELAEVTPYLTPFFQLNKSKEYGSDILLNTALINLLIFLNKMFVHQEEELTFDNVTENRKIKDIIDYINNNLSKSLTLDSLSEQFYISKYYLIREFKKHTGFTVHNYILKRRLLYSKKCLSEHLTASEIYESCGFNNYSHFLKAFKKEFQMTTTEFKKELENIESKSPRQ